MLDYLEGIFQANDVISILDEYLIFETSRDGLITLSLEVIDVKAQRLIEDALQNDRTAITEDNVRRCVGQITCEELSIVEYDTKEVKRALLLATERPWQDTLQRVSIDVGHPGRNGRDTKSPLFSFTKFSERFDHVYIDYIYALC
jgi:hypothetical protein